MEGFLQKKFRVILAVIAFIHFAIIADGFMDFDTSEEGENAQNKTCCEICKSDLEKARKLVTYLKQALNISRAREAKLGNMVHEQPSPDTKNKRVTDTDISNSPTKHDSDAHNVTSFTRKSIIGIHHQIDPVPYNATTKNDHPTGASLYNSTTEGYQEAGIVSHNSTSKNENVAAPDNIFTNSTTRNDRADNNATHNSTTCEHQTAQMLCPAGKVLRIQEADYGRTNNVTCGNYAVYDTNCSSKQAFKLVSARCNSRKSCDIAADNSVFGDPCVHTNKYLTITYTCVQEPKNLVFSRRMKASSD